MVETIPAKREHQPAREYFTVVRRSSVVVRRIGSDAC
jgi:hypothetical protein